jgi:hypothetical protein
MSLLNCGLAGPASLLAATVTPEVLVVLVRVALWDVVDRAAPLADVVLHS